MTRKAKYQQQRVEIVVKPPGATVLERSRMQNAYRVEEALQSKEIQEARRRPRAAVGWLREICNGWTREAKESLAIVDAYPDAAKMLDLAVRLDPGLYRAIAERFPNGQEMRIQALQLADWLAQLVFVLRPTLHLSPQDATAADAERAITAYFNAIKEFPLHMQKRIAAPLYPGQSEFATYDLAGLMLNSIGTTPPVKKVREDQGGMLKDLAPMTAADKKDQNKNKRLINALEEDREEGATLRETLAAQLAGAVFEVAHEPEKIEDLSAFRGALTKLLERGEPDAGKKWPLIGETQETAAREDDDSHEALDRGVLAVEPGALLDDENDARVSRDQIKLAPAETEEFSARDEAKADARRNKWAESLAELRAGAQLTKNEDRALDMRLEGLSPTEIAHHFGPMKTAEQVEQHLVAAHEKIARAAGMAA